jgi:hypothetical protein
VRKIAKYLIKTALVVGVLAIPSSIAWESIFPGKIYHCTDDVWLEYLTPGDWVHGEIEYVDDVPLAMSRTMSDPDVLLRGWTVGRLWMVWAAMFGSSLALGLFLAKFRWFSAGPDQENQSANKSAHPTAGNAQV